MDANDTEDGQNDNAENDGDNTADEQDRIINLDTKLMAWMKCNENVPESERIYYRDMPKVGTWNQSIKKVNHKRVAFGIRTVQMEFVFIGNS